MPIRRLEKTYTGTTSTIGGDEIAASTIPVKPHIQPGVLQPAVAGKLLDGTTNHSGAYGTAQSDGHSYYYTDIKGSKAIKDPRIGAHFGSQRFQMTSIQFLEQETGTHGRNVYSIDGREFMRAVGTITMVNDQYGNFIDMEDDDSPMAFIELVGYFNDANISLYTSTNIMAKAKVNGGSLGNNLGYAAADSPLGGRYVHNGSLVNTEITATLGINTLRIEPYSSSGHNTKIHALELIAQDTSSTANRSKIQIPSQNVVSYGKKFTVSGTPHYDPFNGFTNGTSLHSAFVDTATSLGLDSAPGSSAKWAISSTNNIRPYNGGRVVKWVDSSGTIKTSVTMMPPNAQNIGTTASNEITTPSATNTTTTPNMSDDAIDHSLSEVAKTYNWREFGNGAANGNANATYYADASMMDGSTQDDTAFVMDDGLTSFACNDTRASTDTINIQPNTDGAYYSYTFIGTGVTFNRSSSGDVARTVAQNLPYGTHIVKVYRDADSTPDITIDGIAYADLAADNMTTGFFAYGIIKEVIFHQPKKPPIPEDAVVIADYMLMADFVAQTSEGVENISKGVRLTAPSRDMYYNRSAGSFLSNPFNVEPGASQFHINCWQGNASGTETRILPFFGDSFCMTFTTNSDTNTTAMPLTAGSAGTTALNNWTLTSGGSSVTSLSAAGSLVCAASGAKGFVCAKAGASVELGIQQLKSVGTIASGGYHYQRTFGVHTPIHTSSHYQTFETPFLHELVGGDRNMEQNNLIVTPDGKSWDEVTRDTSYIGKTQFYTIADMSDMSGSTVFVPFDLFRGVYVIDAIQKDFAIAYDRFICLVDGMYNITASGMEKSIGGGSAIKIYINGVDKQTGSGGGANDLQSFNICTFPIHLKRGDYVQLYGWNLEGNNANYSPRLQITKE